MLGAPFERLNSPDPLDDAVPTRACQVQRKLTQDAVPPPPPGSILESTPHYRSEVQDGLRDSWIVPFPFSSLAL